MSTTIKNIVIIGGGYGGISLAKSLDQSLGADHRVILIDKNAHFFHNIGALRTSVENIDNKIFIPYSNLFKKNGVFVQANVTALHKNEVHISPSHSELGSKIHFEYAVIATGAQYPEPAKAHGATKEESIKHLEKTREAIKLAYNILVIGGGPVGIELAAEIKTAYPSKEVTIIHKGPTLIDSTSFSDKFKSKVLTATEAVGVKVVLNEKVILDDKNIGRDYKTRMIKTESGQQYESELQFVAFGTKPNGSIVETLDSSLVNHDTHGIKVRPTLQVDSDAYKHIFAIGDVIDLKGEGKLAMKASKHAELVAKNIHILIAHESPDDDKNKPTPTLHKYKSDPNAMVITLGKNGGIAYLPFFGGMTVGSWVVKTLKSKNLFIDTYWGLLGRTAPKP